VIGQTISHYRIIAKLGEGGMGVVYLGEDTHLARKVAIKFLSSSDPLYRARFLREARAVSNLNHPNIATVHDYGETDDGQPYIVMELVKGQTLNQLLEADTLTLARSIEIVMSIAEALSEAHHHGIVHRDVKPSNVIVNERGQVKVLDFGLVKQLAETGNGNIDHSAPTLFSVRTRSDVIVGTPLYLSPEQATGKPVDGRSDLFALGAVLYECITGRSAFAGQSVIEIGAQVIHVNPPAPSKITLGISSELDRITMKALEKKVDSRYQSAEEFLKDLRGVLPSLSPSQMAQPISRSTLPSVPLRTSALTTLTETLRRPRVSLGTLAIAVVGIVLVIAVLISITRPKPYKPTDAALKWYNDGTAALRNGLFLQAKLAFDQAVSADNNFALAHARLAETLSELEYTGDARTEMLRGLDLVPNRSQLPRVDALYLNAIQATVLGEFPNAIQAYNEIVSRDPTQPHVYFDLGRAYERNNELEKAIDSYREATNRDSQLAAAFLRVGVLYGRKADEASALANFQQAETLYQALGSIEGQAEVSYERGFLFNKQEDPSKARQHLERALELARTARSEYQEIKTLLKLGDVASDERKVSLAQQHIQEALKLAQASGIENMTKRGLIDLGNTYNMDGKYAEAKKYYEQSLELAQKHKDVRNMARAQLSLASVSERLGEMDDVIPNVEQALPFYQKGSYRNELFLASILLARAKVHKGEYDEAFKAYNQALSVAEELGKAQESRAHSEIGILLTKQGKYPEALPHFTTTTELLRILKQPKNEALSLINRANALWRLGKYEEAQSALNEASAIAEQVAAGNDITSWLHLARARMALSQRAWLRAKTESLKALSLSGTEFKTTIVEADFTYGLAQTFSGAAADGRVQCEKAVRLVTELGDAGRLSEALLALADIMLQSGDSQAALTTSRQAQELLTKLGRQDLEWLAWLITARATQKAGDESSAREHAKHATDLLAGLEHKWGADNYAKYLARPDIENFRKQLSELTR
jgi:serine/threonine protein kinase/Tfp pilus assembly protein PilF